MLGNGSQGAIADELHQLVQGLQWDDNFFDEEEGLVAVFDFDYDKIALYRKKVSCVMMLRRPLHSFCDSLKCNPCFHTQRIDWDVRSQHVAVTRDGIKYVRDQRKTLYGLSCSDAGRVEKIVPFDTITVCDVTEPAGATCFCIKNVLSVVDVDSTSSGGEAGHELSLHGLKEAAKFIKLVWAMKRASASGFNYPTFHRVPLLNSIVPSATPALTMDRGLTDEETNAILQTIDTNPKPASPLALRRNTGTDGNSKFKSICIIGGGPVGLMTACMLLDNKKTLEESGLTIPPIKIIIYDRRWNKSTVTWKGHTHDVRQNLEEGSGHRRRQVVTIQSNVWSEFPEFVKNALFQEAGKDYAEYWPLGPDSPKEKGFPRNIPLLYIEDKLLALLQDDAVLQELGVHPEHHPEFRASRANKKELASILPFVDHLILADGGRSETEMLLKEMGVIEKTALTKIPIDDDLVDTVLGIFLNFQDPDIDLSQMLSEKESMAVTISQNRFLLNHLPGHFGFLNMWLAPDERREAVGVSMGPDGSIETVNCNQARPCSWVYNNKDFCCPTDGGAVFLPSLNKSSTLWKTINEALKLYGIPLQCVKEFAKFQLGPYSKRVEFYTDGKFHENAFKVFLLGDAAISVNFRFGRGLNTGLKGAISLTSTLVSGMRDNRLSRDADFVQHHGYMAKLQVREVDIRSIKTMQQTNIIEYDPSLCELCSTEQYKMKVHNIIEGRSFDQSRLSRDLQHNTKNFKRNIDSLAQGFVENLLLSQPWPTWEAGGKEVEIERWKGLTEVQE